MSAIDDLLQVMTDLRNPASGCPWDIRQTSLSIAPHTLDETHELIDAIERADSDNIREELGDLLFNIVFHARIAEEKGEFDFGDVARDITDKMRRRHPHVFGEDRDREWSDSELAQAWQAAKQAEKSARPNSASWQSVDADGTTNSPIYQARQLQQDAADLGFDWPDIQPVFDKLDEELAELRQAWASGDRDAIADELGDLLFVCVNVARHARINAEMSLRRTNQKFQRRFDYVLERMREAGIEMEQGQLEQMEVFWQEAKTVVDQKVTNDTQPA